MKVRYLSRELFLQLSRGAIVGHMPDPQVLSLDDQVAKGSGKQPTLSLTRAGEFTEQKTHGHSAQQS